MLAFFFFLLNLSPRHIQDSIWNTILEWCDVLANCCHYLYNTYNLADQEDFVPNIYFYKPVGKNFCKKKRGMKEFAFPPDCGRNNSYKDFGRNQSYTEQLDPPNYGRKNSCKDNGRNNSNILQRLWSEQLDPPDYGRSQQRPTYLCFKRKMHAISHVGQLFLLL